MGNGYHQDVRSRERLTWSLLFLVLLLPVATRAQGANPRLTTNSPFVRYLQHPPWIKELRFVRSEFTQVGTGPGHITAEGWIHSTNQVSIQPSGMLYQPLSVGVMPPGVPNIGGGPAFQGISDHYYWNAQPAQHYLALSSRRPEEGGTDTNHLQILTEVLKKWNINPVRYFGFPPLLENSFHLTADNQFEATTTEGIPLAGEVLLAADDLPLQLKYFLNGHASHSTLINYKYGGDDLPNYIVCHEPWNPLKNNQDTTNWIESAVFGLDTNIQKGYSPSMFFTNLAIFTHTLIESNGGRYRVEPKGGMESKAVVERYVPSDEAAGVRHRRWRVPVVILALLVGSGLVVWKARQEQ